MEADHSTAHLYIMHRLVANTVLLYSRCRIHRYVAASFLFRPAAGGEGDKETAPGTKQGA
jgi:hypothetical protein